MSWEKREIILPDGEMVMAQAPVIISASRATDIPAFHLDWLIQHIRMGYVQWRNPFNNKYSYISFQNTRLLVFWTKNPVPLFSRLSFFDEYIPNYYIQYTLNDYAGEGLEPNLPSLQERIETFVCFSEKIGKERMIWRFDPLILTDTIGVDELLEKVEQIGNILKEYTNKLVFSFADISSYRKVKNNLQKWRVNYQEFDETAMTHFAAGLQQLNQQWKLQLGSCAEQIDLDRYGIQRNKCVDDELIRHLFSHDPLLMQTLSTGKDKGQRKLCGCIPSKDIGQYNTCPHSCLYCYANNSPLSPNSSSPVYINCP